MTEKRSDYRRRQAEQAEKANRQEAADSAAFPAFKQDQDQKTLKAERLNFAILVVCLLIILVWVILLKF
ncbi:hypothetical protein [Lactobacillus delbrueckii]|uniref:hypothetical protein n=1 Tax=Lactobacillus delbrueckii TaxID=1584 RepID=UPI000E59B336|nr:hypothetical protein [Lactobacillus delbrueckii]MBT8804545.1 hypothetical protein [Lactobacillus delbrueckii subsp. bulgaricus]MBT8806113.1 hypothetical protein [Lactobacillus delbrueckii subsp. bulgaricus]MBT8812364.1 hypothetical protein [Lactobacillus delbrueckii subsp. bulgaricus]MBT8815491.1 hypothetical protein [Lactobacillus delbrueckii subsp. bulgaricus]MBT8818676.1 hypothetical protein [Lactobacillus delbrueckii subsp. bulgaricus]